MTTDPSDLRAANAYAVPCTPTTPEVIWDATLLGSPPEAGSPQTTSEPSDFNAANARSVANTFTTPDDAMTPFPEPQATTDPSDFSAAQPTLLANSLVTPDVRSGAAGFAGETANCPHVTTDPSDLTAAKPCRPDGEAGPPVGMNANDEPKPVIDTTPPASCAATPLESPPPLACPQVTTEPSDFNAANDVALEKICTTPEPSLSATALESPP